MQSTDLVSDDMPAAPATFDAVLSLASADIDRARILIRSLGRFSTGLQTLHVVAPEQQVALIRDAVRSAADQCGVTVTYHVDEEIVPELRLLRFLPGWHRQMMVKLAIYEHVATEFYLTLDADVIATRSFCAADLAPCGRAACYVAHQDEHLDWYRRAARVLGMKPPRKQIAHNVTPALLARDGVRALARHLQVRAQRSVWPSLIPKLSAWRLYLGTRRWTEYSLYYSFLEATGTFETCHREDDVGLYDVGRSLWNKSTLPFSSWNAEAVFTGDDPPYFVIVQSTTQIAPAEIAAKVEPWMMG